MDVVEHDTKNFENIAMQDTIKKIKEITSIKIANFSQNKKKMTDHEKKAEEDKYFYLTGM